MAGKIYFVPTPIGNLKDMTLRAIEILNFVDIIAAEDTRQTIKLLNHFNIKKPLVSYHKFNENDKSMDIIDKVLEGRSVAVVTDAGTPGISDPGFVLVNKCIEKEVPYEVLPGATAITTALLNSGLDMTSFTFIGFLPRENKLKKEKLISLKDREETLIFYEAPHRLRDTLVTFLEILGDRKISICRELTKLHEEILHLTLTEAINLYESKEPKGEFVIVIEGVDVEKLKKEEIDKWESMSIEDHIRLYINDGLDKKEAIKKVSKDRNMPKSEVYKHSIGLDEDKL